MNKGVLTRITKSFGINPSNGGSPPRDRRERAITSFVWDDIELEDDISLGVLILNEKNKYIRIER